MNFSELYNNNRKAVERALIAMWCGESNNDSQRSYIKQMKALIGDLFAPKEWNIGRQPNGERFEVETITHDAKIYLFRNKDIKFDITIENSLIEL